MRFLDGGTKKPSRSILDVGVRNAIRRCRQLWRRDVSTARRQLHVEQVGHEARL